MQWSRQKVTLLAAISVSVIMGGLGSAAVMAAIPDTNGVIHACWRNNSGALKIIDNATQTCAGNETAITWNQTGPAGPTGPQGPAGGSGIGGPLDNLVGADFTGASLHYRNFAGADIHDSIFSVAALTGSDFSNANLSGSTFAGAQLGGRLNKANFSNANFSSATFNIKNAVLRDSNFQGANFANAHLSLLAVSMGNTNFQNTNFGGATLSGAASGDPGPADFQGVNLTGATISFAFQTADFRNVDFRVTSAINGMQFYSGSNLSNANFGGMSFDNVAIYASDLRGANFSNVTTHNLQIGDNTTMTGANLSNAHFIDSYFVGTDLTGANLAGVIWTNTSCPDQTNSDNNGNTCIGHLTP